MTAKRRLIPKSEVKEMLDFLRAEKLLPSGPVGVDIRSDGVTFFPANDSRGSAYDAWKGKDRD